MGRPGASSLPAGAIRPLSASEETVYELSTPLTCSTYALVTGWKYAIIARASSALCERRGGARCSIALAASFANSGDEQSWRFAPRRSSLIPRPLDSYSSARASAQEYMSSSATPRASESRAAGSGSPEANRMASMADLSFSSVMFTPQWPQ